MKSARPGAGTSRVEVANISAHGFWLLVDARELFVSFEQFPWFREAPVGHLLEVERPTSDHLYWPALDVDLSVESIEHPERFPLVSRVRPNNALQRTAGTRRASRRVTSGGARGR